MGIHVYTPTLSVVLTRLVNRVDGSPVPTTSGFKTIDLTPYLGPAGMVRTIKDIHQPAGGFSISFADKMHPEFLDTVYALCEPMDMVEIRASRTPQNYQGTQLPLIMRGFVSSVDRAESMSADGTPQRTVTITGQDSGKLLMINHIYFQVMTITDQHYLETFHMFTSRGIDVGAIPVNDFMHQLIESVVNKKIDQLNVFADAQVKPFVVDATVPDGVVFAQMAINFDQFTVWQLAEFFADRPFNELYTLDAENGPHLVFRPAPYRSLDDGSLIMNGATDPGIIEVDIEDVVAVTTARTDSRVANFFWCVPGASTLDTNAFMNVAALQAGWPLDFSHPNNAPELFGVRGMQVGTNLLPNSISAPVNQLPSGEQNKGINDQTDWWAKRAQQLKAMNRDNSAFEEGGMVCKGSEDYLIGHELQLTRGDVVSSQYITAVSHSIAPLASWSTSLHFTRGTGFTERNKSQSSPYIAEGRKGVYT